MLEQWQIDQYHEQGFLVVENVFTPSEIKSLQEAFNRWVEDSRTQEVAWGETIDGRPRFDVDKDHSAERPSLRRVASPTEISDVFKHTALSSRLAHYSGQLIGGSGARLHHSKVNSKLPYTSTQVKWHQDFPFTPHSNDDLITSLLMVSDVTAENGPLQVIPGSHKGELFSHWDDDNFTGQVSPEVQEKYCQQPTSCFGPAGSVCFMHTRLLHASSPNNTQMPRTLFIAVYAAEDALPYGENPLPSKHEGALVWGESSGEIRSTENKLRLPKKPKGASFFVQQEGQDQHNM
ncbi:phytanoyl-CoA dioxygenase family protein [Reinekea marinisedimentorum]|uniref:Ectoine hydroxylase-related dioxygenase (Phytanoyl-CoA dioxygenase family) n=1 Tax=Reinekea marinisedimentorum TaxID=230495 RepID=A0A4R3I7W9_9GAMM|nr:phytanoyl-CoA dioxygenase family protein [Reinekea marinisedimentorum]TCS42342.1 ectoine hydroxylase-related dioxygenase (phytanoyl-CoA dioxygenase family) [Reinekea marinisedimentorum]